MSRTSRLEDQLKDSKALVERREAVIRLSKNPDFRRVILDEFFVEECARYARESGDPALTPAQRADALAIAQSAGHLKRYLNVQIQLGDAAEASITDLETAIEESRIEEDAEEAAPVSVPDYEEIVD